MQLVKDVTDEFKLSGRRPTTYKDGYSLEFMLRKWHLCLVISLKRHIYGMQGKTKWSSHYQITHMYAMLRAQAAGMGMRDENITRILRSSGGGEGVWALIPSITGEVCDR